MVYRKGELTKAAIDKGWPFQVALEARLCIGHRYYTVRYFCDGLSLCERGHSFFRDGKDYSVFCFAQEDHARAFRRRFSGELMSPRTRPKWGRTG